MNFKGEIVELANDSIDLIPKSIDMSDPKLVFWLHALQPLSNGIFVCVISGHIDDSEFGGQGKIITVIDDCSRYYLGIFHVNTVSTNIVIKFLDELIKKFGAPRQIISDNGSPYGSKSKHSKFDRWCRKRGIEHIRTRVKRPQTNGKVERLFGTIKGEIDKCQELERLRYRYNHHRPHESLKMRFPAEIYDNFNLLIDW